MKIKTINPELVIETSNNERYTVSAGKLDLDLEKGEWPDVLRLSLLNFILSEVASPVYEGDKLLGLEYKHVASGLTLFVENN